MTTAAEAVESAARRLATSGIPDAALDAEQLLRHVLDWDRARWVAEARATVPEEALTRFAALIEERARRRPLQHLTGRQAFWRHELLVTPDVLIPRPETEILVEVALALLGLHDEGIVVDVGTGSGNIALSIAAERARVRVHATDISAPALVVARENAKRLGLEERVVFHQGDLLAPVEHLPTRAILSNPPYVAAAEREGLQPEVRDHDPAVALFAPDEPYSVYRRLVPSAARQLLPGGWLILEVGAGMATEVAAIVRAAGLEVRAIRPDLQSIPRVVVAQRP